MINFSLKSFSELSLEELYAIMILRQEVFVVEQDCVYLDADNKDQNSWHLLGENEDGELVAYLRILPKGVSYESYPSIGRIVTSSKVRRQGAGKALLAESLKHADRLYPGANIKISAQTYLLRFYRSFGFEPTGEEYLEDGIPHMAMVRRFK
jgi:ElaA protein